MRNEIKNSFKDTILNQCNVVANSLILLHKCEAFFRGQLYLKDLNKIEIDKVTININTIDKISNLILSNFDIELNEADSSQFFNLTKNNTYYKAKYYHILGLYHIYKLNDLYGAYDLLLKAYELYFNLPQFVTDLVFLTSDLSSVCIANREPMLSLYLHNKIMERCNQSDVLSHTILKCNLSANLLPINENEGAIKCLNSLNYNTIKTYSENLYQIALKENFYCHMYNYKIDSLINILSKCSHDYVNINKLRN